MSRFRPFLLLAAAVVVALISTLLIYNYIQKRATVKSATAETQTVAVAVVDLNWGTVIRKEMIKTEPYLKSSLPVGYFPDATSLEGRVLLSPIKAKEPILESRLAPTTMKAGGVAAVVSPKKRAVGVRVDRVIGVAGFIHPGNRVDVLVTITSQEIKEPVTKIVLENILVLAAGPEVEQKGKGEKPAQVDVITLEVTPEDAEKLAMSVTQGKIQLALRSFVDNEDVLTKGITIPALLASYSGGSPVKSAKPGPRKPTQAKKPGSEKQEGYTVELIKAGKVNKVTF
jgi:pilus assembly protein CpaB